ncbi:GNAT family N-acetyltransferase [Marinigracilibium pacificum]|uniref:GNAT family N-acetyltransferase n=1 Tax=Marinigracilibium pacificum TaxID=2729599 RepID=A0A848IX68_9BACT|nr:GNAT family protein [Marinigracilibium pacificum]NMM49123.1 GNAT family N-acetyltransferase [Marinigracilibium pacificum]
MSNWLKNIELEGKIIKLVPLTKSHREGLIEASNDGNLSELWFTSVPSEEQIDDYINFALNQEKNGSALAFVVIHKETQKIIGCTRYCNVASEHRRLEIGYTWYAASFQRTGVNTECKYLLLKHAFETLDCICVQFKTDWFNINSRNAIARLGAKQDGILRNDRLNKDGSYRDTVVFSITNNEWHGVEKNLKLSMSRYS